jgi:ribose-phosphate pyrophosphokinase
MEPIFFALPDSQVFAERFAQMLDVRVGKARVRRFPDGESWVRILEDCTGREAVIVANLSRPDLKVSQLMFMAETLRDLGASRVGLVAPYLAYMRQDERFEPGEGVTSHYFAEFVARYFDWLVTLDPHLHRHGTLTELYRIPTFAAHSAPFVARWLDDLHIDPVLIGPDAESEQWVGAVAAMVGCPHVIFEKTRHGDRDVELEETDLSAFDGKYPVILDDIISTGTTMAETIERVTRAGLPRPLCVGIHGVFADDAHAKLIEGGAERVLTCNSIPHPTNAIDITPALAEQIGAALRHMSADAAE